MPTFSLVRKKNRKRRNGPVFRVDSSGRFTPAPGQTAKRKRRGGKRRTRGRASGTHKVTVGGQIKANPFRRANGRKSKAKSSGGRGRASKSRAPRTDWKKRALTLQRQMDRVISSARARGQRAASGRLRSEIARAGAAGEWQEAAMNPRRRKRRKSRKASRRRNPGGLSLYRSSKRRKNRRRSRGRRRNPFHSFRRRKNRRRRNPFAVRRRNPFSRSGSMDLAGQVLGGTIGLSVALWGPKLLGHKVNAMLGRGWGGVATSAVSVGAVSWVVSRFVDKKFGTKLGPSILVGGGIGVVASLFSAISCGYRQQFLPFESSLLACALPMAPASPVKDAANQAQALAAKTGMPISAAVAQIAAGLKGYDNPGTQHAAAMIAGELASRAGLNDYVSNRDVPGLRDYPGLNPGPAAQAVGMDASKETF